MDKNQNKKEGLPLGKDKSAVFEWLFLSYYPMLFQIGFRLSANAAFTKDQIQDFFMQLWESDFQPLDIQHLSAYLQKAFHRRVLRALQKEPKHKGLSPSEKQLENIPSYESLLIQSQRKEEEKDRLAKALAQLPVEQKKVLSFRFYEGLSYDEIASNTGKSRQTIYNQVHGAIKKLKGILKKG